MRKWVAISFELNRNSVANFLFACIFWKCRMSLALSNSNRHERISCLCYVCMCCFLYACLLLKTDLMHVVALGKFCNNFDARSVCVCVYVYAKWNISTITASPAHEERYFFLLVSNRNDVWLDWVRNKLHEFLIIRVFFFFFFFCICSISGNWWQKKTLQIYNMQICCCCLFWRSFGCNNTLVVFLFFFSLVICS